MAAEEEPRVYVWAHPAAVALTLPLAALCLPPVASRPGEVLVGLALGLLALRSLAAPSGGKRCLGSSTAGDGDGQAQCGEGTAMEGED